jgi:hypothetical protein
MLEVRPQLHVIDVMERRRAVSEYRRLFIESGGLPASSAGSSFSTRATCSQ